MRMGAGMKAPMSGGGMKGSMSSMDMPPALLPEAPMKKRAPMPKGKSKPPARKASGKK